MIALATEFNDRPGTPIQTLINMYAEATPQGPREYVLRARPGLVRAVTPQHIQLGTGPIHGVLQVDLSTYVLSGTAVYLNGTLLTGAVASGGYKQFARSADQIVLVSGYAAYLVTSTTVTQITDADLPEVMGVVFSNGVFVYPQRGSDIYFFSAVNDATTIDGLGFSSAESAADPIFRVETLNDELVFIGTETVEYHSPTPDPDTPFRRAAGRTQLKGTASPQAVVKADNGLYFPGQDRNSGRAIYRIDGGIAKIVSTPTIDAALEAVDGFDIVDATGFALVRDGQTFVVFNAPGVGSYGLNVRTGKWSVWESYGEVNFRITAGDGAYYGDTDGYLFTFAPETYTDDSAEMVRTCSAWIPTIKPVEVATLHLESETGVSLVSGTGSDAVVEERDSDDLTGSYSSWVAESLGLIGDRAARVMWSQLGTIFKPGRVVEFRVSDPVRWVPVDVLINEPVT